jgi:hypothetical protein
MSVDEELAELRSASDAWRKGPSAATQARFDTGASTLADAGIIGHIDGFVATSGPEVVAPDFSVVTVASVVEAECGVMVLSHETAADGAPRVHAGRYFPLGGDNPAMTRGTKSALPMAFYDSEGTWLFADFEHPPIAFEGASTAQMGDRDRLALFGKDRLRIVEASSGKDILGSTPVPEYASIGAQWAKDGQWFASCESLDRVAWVVDAVKGEELFRSPDEVLACALDEPDELVIVATSANGRDVSVEAWSLATHERVMASRAKPAPLADLVLDVDALSHSVTLSEEPYQMPSANVGRFDLRSGKELPLARPSKRAPKANPLEGIPVGEADVTTSLTGLDRLAAPGHQLVDPWFHLPAGWAANGVLSTDRKTLLLLESTTPDSGDVDVIIADAATLAVRSRVDLSSPLPQWAKVYFLDPRTAVARLEWHYWVIDVERGSVVMDFEDEPVGAFREPHLLAPRLFAVSSRLFDLGLDGSGGRPIDTPYTTLYPEAKQTPDGAKHLSLGDVELTIDANGRSTITKGAAAPWLHCRVRDEIFPAAACRRFARAR